MKDKHIINLLESAPLAELSESDLSDIRAHANECAGCHQAFEAAQIAVLLLKERAAETFEPPPFFHTRVMAALRERQTTNEWVWSRMWRAAGALASSMAATVAALAVLTFVIPGQNNAVTSESTALHALFCSPFMLLSSCDLYDRHHCIVNGYAEAGGSLR